MESVTNYWDNMSYQSVKNTIQNNMGQIKRSFVAIGFYLRLVRNKKLYLEDGYANIWEFAEAEYGIKMSAASRWMAINEKFSENGYSPILSIEYRDFGKSQLQEMLYLNDEQMKQASPDMTKQQIRDIRKPEPENDQIPGQDGILNHPELMPAPEPPNEEPNKADYVKVAADAIYHNITCGKIVRKLAEGRGPVEINSLISSHVSKLHIEDERFIIDGKNGYAKVTDKKRITFKNVSYMSISVNLVERYGKKEEPQPAAVPEPIKPEPVSEPEEPKPSQEECFREFYEKFIPEEVKGWAKEGSYRRVGAWINDNKEIPYTEVSFGWIHGNLVKLVFEDKYKYPLYTFTWYSVRELIMKIGKEEDAAEQQAEEIQKEIAPAQEPEIIEVSPDMVEDPEEHVCDTCKNASPITGNAAKCDKCQASGEDYEAFDQKEPLIDRAKLIDAIKNYFKDRIENDAEADIYEINANIMEIIDKL